MTFKYLSYLSPEVMLKFTRRARGHFVILNEIGVHVFEYNPVHNTKVLWFIS